MALLICEVFAESQRERVIFNLKRSKQHLERQMGQRKVKMNYKIQQLDPIYRVIQQINNFIIPLLRHFTIFGQENAQNMRR